MGLGVNPAGLSLPVPAPPEGAAVCIVGGRGTDLAPPIPPFQKEGEMGRESHRSPRPAGLQEQRQKNQGEGRHSRVSSGPTHTQR